MTTKKQKRKGGGGRQDRFVENTHHCWYYCKLTAKSGKEKQTKCWKKKKRKEICDENKSSYMITRAVMYVDPVHLGLGAFEVSGRKLCWEQGRKQWEYVRTDMRHNVVQIWISFLVCSRCILVFFPFITHIEFWYSYVRIVCFFFMSCIHSFYLLFLSFSVTLKRSHLANFFFSFVSKVMISV